eukprot:3793829-Alexandrium_andersonii.AAC.1
MRVGFGLGQLGQDNGHGVESAALVALVRPLVQSDPELGMPVGVARRGKVCAPGVGGDRWS